MPDAAAPLTTRFTRRQRLPLLLLSCAVVTPLVALLLGGGLAMLALKTALMLGANAAHAALGLSPQAAVTLGSAIGGALLAVFTELTNLPLQALTFILWQGEPKRPRLVVWQGAPKRPRSF